MRIQVDLVVNITPQKMYLFLCALSFVNIVSCSCVYASVCFTVSTNRKIRYHTDRLQPVIEAKALMDVEIKFQKAQKKSCSVRWQRRHERSLFVKLLQPSLNPINALK